MNKRIFLYIIFVIALDCNASMLENIKKAQACIQKYKKESNKPILDAITSNKYENVYELYTDFTKNWHENTEQKEDRFVGELEAEGMTIATFVNSLLNNRRHYLITNYIKQKMPNLKPLEIEKWYHAFIRRADFMGKKSGGYPAPKYVESIIQNDSYYKDKTIWFEITPIPQSLLRNH